MIERLSRINKQIHKELNMFLRVEFPKQCLHITITDVKIAPDLRHAQVFFSVINEKENLKDAVSFFRSHNKQIRYFLGKKVRMKYTPDLHFIFDENVSKTFNTCMMLNKIESEMNSSSSD